MRQDDTDDMPPLVALLAWPLVAAFLFARMAVPAAAVATLLAGYLLLPTATEIDLPALPALSKYSIPALAALFLALVINGRGQGAFRPSWAPRAPVAWMLLIALLGGAFMTAISNGEAVDYGPTTLPGLRLYDAFSLALDSIVMLLPLLLGRKLLAGRQGHLLLLRALVIGGFAYSFLALYEVRMSPQLNQMLYGFFPHSWVQHVRGNGFRPLVFLSHGLSLSIFFSACVLAAFGLSRLDAGGGRLNARSFRLIGLWLLMTLVLSKSLGALVITLILLPVVLALRRRGQLIVAAVVVASVLAFPMLRSSALVPVDRVLELAESISPERAASLQVRVENEDALLEKALQKPMFGWGGWGRSRIVDEYGVDNSIADGYWIIVLGVSGWVGYLGTYGLLGWPTLKLALRPRRIGMETSCLALIMAGNLVDTLPNATASPVTWLIAGALWGRLETAGTEGDGEGDGEAATPAAATNRAAISDRRSVYTRQHRLHRRNADGPSRNGR